MARGRAWYRLRAPAFRPVAALLYWVMASKVSNRRTVHFGLALTGLVKNVANYVR
jgi:hypothetical protein